MFGIEDEVISTLQEQIEELKTKVVELEKYNDTAAESRIVYESRIDELKSNYREAQELLEYKDDQISKLKAENERLKEQACWPTSIHYDAIKFDNELLYEKIDKLAKQNEIYRFALERIAVMELYKDTPIDVFKIARNALIDAEKVGAK